MPERPDEAVLSLANLSSRVARFHAFAAATGMGLSLHQARSHGHLSVWGRTAARYYLRRLRTRPRGKATSALGAEDDGVGYDGLPPGRHAGGAGVADGAGCLVDLARPGQAGRTYHHFGHAGHS